MHEGGTTPADRAATGSKAVDDILASLARLDRRLQHAVETARATFGAEAVADPFKGLHISTTEVERLLRRSPAATLFASDESVESVEPPAPLRWLARAFDLSPFDLEVVLIALAPELDLRYERIYAFLQNDVTRRRPSVELALDVLCRCTADKIARRARFAADAPLIRHGLVELVKDPQQVRPPLLSHFLKLDEQVTRLLLDERSLDPRLAHCCTLVTAASSIDELPIDARLKSCLRGVVRRAQETEGALHVRLVGPSESEKRQIARALAAEIGQPLLVADLTNALAGNMHFDAAARLVFREARFLRAILYLDAFDSVLEDDKERQRRTLVEQLAAQAGLTLLSGNRPWAVASETPLRLLPLPIPFPDFHARRDAWTKSLAAEGLTIGSEEVDILSGRFRLSANQITQAVANAAEHAHCRATADLAGALDRAPRPGLSDLSAAARDQCGHDLAALTRKIQARYRWSDIVLPDDTLAQLREICQRETQRHRVMKDWGFDEKLSHGKGVNALFAGPSGTGKTMAAEIIAGALGLDLYKIDLASIVSKYIGETEKNLDRIFTAAENANCILLFDEADALFGKRSEVRDSHDRYANLEISYLLQKMEQYEGIAILATNLRENMDQAFTRRLAFTVHFPFPSERDRERIWNEIWPRATPLADDVDIRFLARQFKLSGGNIKNIALASAFGAAADGGTVNMSHVRHAVLREYQKLGKTVSAAELTGSDQV